MTLLMQTRMQGPFRISAGNTKNIGNVGSTNQNVDWDKAATGVSFVTRI